ncbi:type I restriction and modification enzyme subunit R-like protein [Anseongella ginsenosidimutans]|uniref:Type I restriction and modification enzyme subunit R-like protein n=1 Tax=Anseongella ginsenosidimutans TaxID=496056 RepID=A0A4R3KP25_9SPHI|nr:type I restriction enzyme HsdR N-terminal domain-containing protein [Anseongella ginsenosidimutans]QEC53949.1 type I restriction enzyme HsdR N-terminal domain-containing protein [Anseongella ginsenosidimutans]TCS86336.1 type I restriction and modification enzyme subunit R-like protein [Anseongella ginsenosidimutans]
MSQRPENILVPLNFPPYPFRLQEREEKLYIFDELRKKHLLCTPEEWVRQHLIRYMIKQKQYPRGLVQIEGGLSVNERKRRCDVLFFGSRGQEYLLAECKSPAVKISDKVFAQAALYNTKHKAKYLLVTNGLHHFCCEMDYEGHSYRFMEQIPAFTP